MVLLRLTHRFISVTSQQQLVNVAVNKVTSIARTDHPWSEYHKWGHKNLLVDGLRNATGSGAGCSGCFASNAAEGYWQVDLDQEYYVPYINIVGVLGEIYFAKYMLKFLDVVYLFHQG